MGEELFLNVNPLKVYLETESHPSTLKGCDFLIHTARLPSPSQYPGGPGIFCAEIWFVSGKLLR